MVTYLYHIVLILYSYLIVLSNCKSMDNWHKNYIAMALASNLVWDLTCVIITWNRTPIMCSCSPIGPLIWQTKDSNSLYPVRISRQDSKKKLPKGFCGHLSHHYSYGHVNYTHNHASLLQLNFSKFLRGRNVLFILKMLYEYYFDF